MEKFEMIRDEDNPLHKLLLTKNIYGIIKPIRKCIILLGDFLSTTADLFIVDNKIINIDDVSNFKTNDELIYYYKNKIIYGVYLQSYYFVNKITCLESLLQSP